MHEHTARRITAPLMALLIAAPSPALANCLAPHPVCGLVLLGGIVTGAVAQRNDTQPEPLQPVGDAATTRPVVAAVARDEGGDMGLRMRDASRSSAGFPVILRRFGPGRHRGPMSLESLRDFDRGSSRTSTESHASARSTDRTRP